MNELIEANQRLEHQNSLHRSASTDTTDGIEPRFVMLFNFIFSETLSALIFFLIKVPGAIESGNAVEDNIPTGSTGWTKSTLPLLNISEAFSIF